MIEVHPGLFVGDEADEFAIRGATGWFVVHACKEPFHRNALNYTGRSVDKRHPEYLVAHRPGCVILNLIDAPDPQFVSSTVIAAAVQAIAANIVRSKVLVHCNRGKSRAPTIALLYLALETSVFDECAYDEAIARFYQIYPPYAPAGGMGGFARLAWMGAANFPDAPIEAPEIVTPRLTPRSGGSVVFRF